jgi:NADH-quinone oxidoreductase subunit J
MSYQEIFLSPGDIVFYFFALLSLISGILVINSKNSVTSVLSLILAFCCTSAMLTFLGFDFFAMIFIVVYVGAISVLFLFVVMMIHIKVQETFENIFHSLPIYVPLGTFMSSIFLFVSFHIVNANFSSRISNVNLAGVAKPEQGEASPYTFIEMSSNIIESMGTLIYVYYCSYFILASFVLLVAMIGAIVLTLRQQDSSSKAQDIASQNLRSSEVTKI